LHLGSAKLLVDRLARLQLRQRDAASVPSLLEKEAVRAAIGILIQEVKHRRRSRNRSVDQFGIFHWAGCSPYRYRVRDSCSRLFAACCFGPFTFLALDRLSIALREDEQPIFETATALQ